MKVALIQFNAGLEKSRNIIRAKDLVCRAAGGGGQLVLLPEGFLLRADAATPRMIAEAAEPIDGPTVREFQLLAREHKIYLVLGSIYERRRRGRPYNTMVVISPDGKRIARYRKIHLFAAKVKGRHIQEAALFSPGKERSFFRIGRFLMGGAICYDLRFPEMFGKEKRRRCDVFVVPSCFTHETGKAHWEVLLRARAIENKAYVLAPNQCGKGGDCGVTAFGNSMVVDPWGRVLARAAGKKQEVVFADIH